MSNPQWDFDEMRRNARIDHTGERLSMLLHIIDELQACRLELTHIKGTIYAVRATLPRRRASDMYRLN